jgi:NmrA-like family
VKHLVFLSVDGAQKRSWVPHRKVEDHLRGTSGSWTVLRPGFFAQNLGDAYCIDVRDDSRLFVPAADGRVAFLDVADIGDVAARIFALPERFRGQAMRLAGPEAITFAQLAKRLSNVLGRQIVYEPASIVGYLWHLRRHRHLSLMQAIVFTVLHVGLRDGDAQTIDDQQLALLGRPATPIANYLERSKALWTKTTKSLVQH